MKVAILVMLVMPLVGCAATPKYLNTPNAVVKRNLKYAHEGNGEARWNLSSDKLKAQMIENFGSKEKAIECLSEDYVDFSRLQTWKTRLLSKTDKTAVVEITAHGIYDGKTLTKTDTINLVFQKGQWLIDE